MSENPYQQMMDIMGHTVTDTITVMIGEDDLGDTWSTGVELALPLEETTPITKLQNCNIEEVD
jgi:hypothetical protein